MLLDKLAKIEEKYVELEKELAKPETLNDRDKFQKYSKELADIREMVEKFRELKKINQHIPELREMLKDSELKELAETELKDLENKSIKLVEELEVLMLPKDPLDDKNIFIEIRAGTGGDEAALFSGDLTRMYLRYAENCGWKTEIVSSNPTGLGGYKEIIFAIYGKGAYSRFKYESGTHRVQRVPATEASGRVHTSATTVAVLPEAEEIDLKIEDKDLRVDTFRASGAGGQHVNKTDSAVRITHIPSGIFVASQSERSQHQNRAKAMKLLRAKIFEMEQEKQRKEIEAARRGMVGSGDRSEKIRTYNFPQGRVTDHRINLTVYNLANILDGNIDEIIDALAAAERVEKLSTVE